MKSDHASRQAHASEFWRAAPNAEPHHLIALHTDAPDKSQKEHEVAGLLSGYSRKKIERTPGQGWRLGPREVSNLFPMSWEPLAAVGETVTVTFRLHSDDLAFFGRDNRPVVEPGEFHVWVGGDSEAGLRAAFRLLAAGAAQ